MFIPVKKKVQMTLKSRDCDYKKIVCPPFYLLFKRKQLLFTLVSIIRKTDIYDRPDKGDSLYFSR